MATMLERRQAVTGQKERPSTKLVDQKVALEQATRKTAGLASRAYAKKLAEEFHKLRAADPSAGRCIEA